MKSSESKTIRNEDYEIVADALGLKMGTVRMIRMGYRADLHNVMKALEMAITHRAMSREQLRKKLSRLKQNRKPKLQGA